MRDMEAGVLQSMGLQRVGHAGQLNNNKLKEEIHNHLYRYKTEHFFLNTDMYNFQTICSEESAFIF